MVDFLLVYSQDKQITTCSAVYEVLVPIPVLGKVFREYFRKAPATVENLNGGISPMSKLVPPHGGKGLVCCLLEGKALEEEKKKAEKLPKIDISSRAKGDLIMMGIGGFSPLDGFMGKADWKSVCEKMTLADGTFGLCL